MYYVLLCVQYVCLHYVLVIVLILKLRIVQFVLGFNMPGQLWQCPSGALARGPG